jgi:hypothetical protein
LVGILALKEICGMPIANGFDLIYYASGTQFSVAESDGNKSVTTRYKRCRAADYRCFIYP